MPYNICIQPKKQFKGQIIGILEEIDSFIDQKCTAWKWAKKLGRALPLIVGQFGTKS